MKLLRLNVAGDIVVVPINQVIAVVKRDNYVQVRTVGDNCFYVEESFEEIIKALSDA